MSPEDRMNDDSDSLKSIGDASSFRVGLHELVKSHSGINVVYSVLDLLARCYDLEDVVVILADESFSAQFFRLGGKAVRAELAARLGERPALYCNPDVVPRVEREEALEVCQRAFSEQLLRFSTTRGAYGDEVVERSLEGSSDDLTIATRAKTPLTSWRDLDSRMVVSMALALADVLILGLTIGDVHGPLRFILGLVVGLVIPGWSIVGLIGLRSAALEIGLSLATSLSLVMVAAQIMITLHSWHPVALEEVTCLVCLPSLLWQTGHFRRVVGA
jgi:hypothetical protein